MRPTICLCAILALVSVSAPTSANAQTNSWISPYRGYWDDGDKWSLRVAPTNSHSVYITNDVSKTVTIDSYTSGTRPDTMTVSNLNLWAPTGVTNTLELTDAGTNVPLRILDTLTVSAGGVLDLTYSALSMRSVTNVFTNGVLSVDGIMVLHNNGLVMADSGLFVGVDSNASGSCLVAGGQLFLTNTVTSAIGVNGSGQMIVSNGQVQAQSGFVILGSGSGSQGALAVAGGDCVCSGLGRFALGMETGAVGTITVSAGDLVMTDAFITLVGGDGVGQLNLLNGTNTLGPVELGGDPGSQGTLTIAGGVNNVQRAIFLGSTAGATGTIWMTDGQLVQTNAYLTSGVTNFSPTCVGTYGTGFLTVSNGYWLGGTMTVASEPGSRGTINVDGGLVTLLSELTIGNCPDGGVGVVNVSGGGLYVTNATHDAFIDLRNGQLNLNGGVLQVDTLIITNSCGLFVRNGGTLTVGNIVLDPNLDADGDGLPNGWEEAYGLDPLNAADANVDSDGDGFSNLQEYRAGTDPTNSASAFRVIDITPDGDDLLITWTAVGGKRYAVQTTTGSSLGFSNDFVDLNPAFIAPGTGETVMTVLNLGAATNSPARYYRVRLVR
ncbi:MAG TPA: thrombospondin type 3 repeat-containing protein [Verrucomicrobiae bacterium]|nr:thrombospondin type 3 repeat-containing protein [Verrucomicrobiae bacterium]